MASQFDVIGDIHGAAPDLRALLRELGYRDSTGVLTHGQGRTTIFTGDYVDSGKYNLDVVEIVRGMVEAGSAQALMGNHDFNIVALNRADPLRAGKYLRDRSTKNITQCLSTQTEIEGAPHRGWEALDFLAGLPLWLDLGHSRFVHACWDSQAMAGLRPFLDERNALTEVGFIAAATPDGLVGDARSMLLSGPEIVCEPYTDRYGHVRTHDRKKWWLETTTTGTTPLFFGHYALPCPLSIYGNAICLDAGIARGGHLVGYRFEVGEPLDCRHLVYM